MTAVTNFWAYIPVGAVWLNPERPDTQRKGHGGADPQAIIHF